MLRKAKSRLEQVLKESPPTSLFLLGTLGEISFSLGIRVQNERMEFELADESLRNLIKAEGAFREVALRRGYEQDKKKLLKSSINNESNSSLSNHIENLNFDGLDPNFLSRARNEKR